MPVYGMGVPTSRPPPPSPPLNNCRAPIPPQAGLVNVVVSSSGVSLSRWTEPISFTTGVVVFE
jgi:hypothetical protein